jgi:hypothetical protein
VPSQCRIVKAILLLILAIACIGGCGESAKSPPTMRNAASAAAPFTLNTRPTVARGPKRASFKLELASHEARHVADWAVDSGDNRSMPFAIVDKTDAKVFVFDADGGLSGAAPALLGLALGDDSVPGIGDRALSSIRPEERTTPAGRFVAELGPSLNGGTVLWVNYDEGLAIHALRPADPKQRRPQRLSSPTPFDKRISLGCVVVPVKFFANVVLPAFKGMNGIVYILPDTKLVSEVFASYDVEERARRQSTSQATSAHVVSPTAPL